MNRKYIFAALMAACMVSCETAPSFKITGKVSSADEKTLYFEYSGINGVEMLDSVKLDKSGNFSFKQNRPETPDFYRLRIENRIINFVADSTETISLDADYSNFALKYNIGGSEDNRQIQQLVQLQAELQSKVAGLAKSGMPIGIMQDSINARVDAYKDNVKRNYIFKAPDRPYAYFALFQQLNGIMIFDPVANRDDIKCFAAVATSMNTKYPHSDRSRNLYNMVIRGMNNTRKPAEPVAEIPADKIREATIIDIPLKDIKGQVKHLTELKGKVVLIDFTAYASAASGARNLALRELYSKYHAEGLEIYQISLDNNEHFWKVSANNLPWICVRDPQGPYSTYVNLYGVDKLPTSFLVNRNNEVCLRMGEKTDFEAEIKKLL